MGDHWYEYPQSLPQYEGLHWLHPSSLFSPPVPASEVVVASEATGAAACGSSGSAEVTEAFDVRVPTRSPAAWIGVVPIPRSTLPGIRSLLVALAALSRLSFPTRGMMRLNALECLPSSKIYLALPRHIVRHAFARAASALTKVPVEVLGDLGKLGFSHATPKVVQEGPHAIVLG